MMTIWKKRLPLIVATTVFTFAMITLSGCAGGVPDDKVKQDVATSDIVTNGLVSSSFTNETPYELSELKVGKQADEDVNAFGIEKARRVDFSGKVKNESFESSFTGHAYYTKQGDSWTCISGISSDSSSSTPLKGVDSISTTKSISSNETITEFDSTLDESNGAYSSSAKQTTSIDEWFATDTITTEQGFNFTSKDGWKQAGDPKATATKTDYKLAGKKFSCRTVPGISNSEGKVIYLLDITNIAENGTITANYSIDYDPLTDIGFLSYTFSSVHEKGTLTGKLDRQAGSPSFSAELNDPSKGVTFECESASSTISAGTGTVNAMSVKSHTSFVYTTSPEGETMNLSTSGTFVEVLN